MIIISMSGTHLSSRGITCHEEGKTKNEVRIALGDWMITQYLGAGGRQEGAKILLCVS